MNPTINRKLSACSIRKSGSKSFKTQHFRENFEKDGFDQCKHIKEEGKKKRRRLAVARRSNPRGKNAGL